MDRSLRNRWLWGGGAVLVTAFLQHKAWQSPRFIAEEGTFTFGTALRQGFFETLIQPFFGYLAILSNAGNAIAAQLPLDLAPYATMGLGFSLQAFLAYAIATAKAEWLAPPLTRALALIAYFGLLGTHCFPATTWSAQYLMALPPLLLLVTGEGQRPSWPRLLVLLLSGLSGILPTTLTALYGLRWLSARNRRHFFEAAVLATGALVQYLLLKSGAGPMAMASDGALPTGRSSLPGLIEYLEVFTGRITLPLLCGPAMAGEAITTLRNSAPLLRLSALLAGALCFPLIALLAGRHRLQSLSLITALFVMFTVVLIGAWGDREGLSLYQYDTERYFVALKIAAIWGTLAALSGQSRKPTKIALALLSLLLCLQALAAIPRGSAMNYPGAQYSWQSEVKAFQSGAQSILRSWPEPFLIQPPWPSGEAARIFSLDPEAPLTTEPLQLQVSLSGPPHALSVDFELRGPPNRALRIWLTPILPFTRLKTSPPQSAIATNHHSTQSFPAWIGPDGEFRVSVPVAQLKTINYTVVGFIRVLQAELLPPPDHPEAPSEWSRAFVLNTALD